MPTKKRERADGACKEITYLKYGSSFTSGSRIEAEWAGGQIVWNEMSLNIPGYVLETAARLFPLRSATVHRFVASETPGLFMGSRVRSSAAMRTARPPLIVSPSCVSVDARVTVTTGNRHGIGSPYRRRGLEPRV